MGQGKLSSSQAVSQLRSKATADLGSAPMFLASSKSSYIFCHRDRKRLRLSLQWGRQVADLKLGFEASGLYLSLFLMFFKKSFIIF